MSCPYISNTQKGTNNTQTTLTQMTNDAIITSLLRQNDVTLTYQWPGLILGLRPANERRRYKITPSLIGWPQT